MSKSLYVTNVEDLIDERDDIDQYEIGIEFVNSNTGKTHYYKADVVWLNEEWEEVTFTVNVENLEAEELEITT